MAASQSEREINHWLIDILCSLGDFASLHCDVKFKTTPEGHFSWCPLGSKVVAIDAKV